MKKYLFCFILLVSFIIGCNDKSKNDKNKVNENKIQEIKNNLNKENETNLEENSNIQKENNLIETVEPNLTNGEILYKECASCHGPKANQEALGKSQIIAGWDEERLLRAMQGYKNQTYGGAMKKIMKKYVDTKTNEELKALAQHIANISSE